MSRMVWLAFGLTLCCAIGGCQSGSTRGWGACVFDELRVEADFPGARGNRCRREGENTFAVRIEPEDTPINPSPWYAFRITARRIQGVEVVLRYAEARHRYTPKLSYDGSKWFEIDEDRIEIAPDGQSAILRLAIGPEPLWVAAQELLTNRDYERWTEQLTATHPDLERRILGTSLDGRPIWTIDTAPDGIRRGTVVIIGRQHPPEVTGALAMTAFVERLLRATRDAEEFRERYRLVVIPNLNPDGVTHGHWRHNRGGVDLNRDWGPFTQPETRLARDLLARIAASEASPLTLVLDFHSTWRDLMYTQRDEDPTRPPRFTSDWIASIQQRMPDYQLERDVENTGRPSVRTYVYERYGVPSITFEVGDDTDRESIVRISDEAAAALIETLMKH